MLTQRQVTSQPATPVALSQLAQFLGFEIAWTGVDLNAAGLVPRRASMADSGGVTPAYAVGRGMTGKTFSGSGTGRVIVPVTDTVACTFVVIYSDITGGASALGRLVSTFNGSGGHDIYCDGSSIILQEFLSGGTSQRTLASTPGTGSTPVCLAWSTDGTTSPTSIASVDGSAATVNATANSSGSRVAGGTSMGIGGRPDTTGRQIGARIFFAARSRFALDQVTLDRISARPWQSLLQVRAGRRIWAPSAGGTTYNVDLTETASPTDAASTVATLAASVTETASPTDALSCLATFGASVSETVSASDVVLALLAAVAAVSEAASAADSTNGSIGAATYNVSVAESAAPSDAVSIVAQLVAQIAEAASGGDAYTTAAQLVALLTESASPVDSISVPGSASVSISEAASALDVIVATVSAVMGISAPPVGHGPTAGMRAGPLLGRRSGPFSRSR